MSAYKQNLLDRIEAISIELQQMDCEKAGGSPNVKQADGGTVLDHVGYRLSLLKELGMLQDLVAKANAIENGGDSGPFELETTFY